MKAGPVIQKTLAPSCTSNATFAGSCTTATLSPGAVCPFFDPRWLRAYPNRRNRCRQFGHGQRERTGAYTEYARMIRYAPPAGCPGILFATLPISLSGEATNMTEQTTTLKRTLGSFRLWGLPLGWLFPESILAGATAGPGRDAGLYDRRAGHRRDVLRLYF